jgi:hypothetical protein
MNRCSAIPQLHAHGAAFRRTLCARSTSALARIAGAARQRSKPYELKSKKLLVDLNDS